MPSAIELQGLTKRFRGRAAVEDVNLALAPGTACGLLGRNGAGKTTTLRMIVNLETPDAGEARLFGVSSRKLRAADFAGIGYVSENQRHPDWMTVGQYMRFLCPLYPTWDTAFERKLIRLFELPEDRKMRGFSRGMKMKAAILAAIAYRPRLLILDEPFGGLDTLVREEVLEALMEVTAQEEWTVLLSSHDVDEVERLCDDIALLREARLVLRESIADLQERFRAVTFLLDPETPLRGQTADWYNVKRNGRLVSLVHGRFAEAEFPPGAESIQAESMPLKTISTALLRGPGALESLTD